MIQDDPLISIDSKQHHFPSHPFVFSSADKKAKKVKKGGT